MLERTEMGRKAFNFIENDSSFKKISTERKITTPNDTLQSFSYQRIFMDHINGEQITVFETSVTSASTDCCSTRAMVQQAI